MNVMLDDGGIRTAIHSDPKAFEEVWWGKKLAAVRVDLRRVDTGTLRDLLEEARELRARAASASRPLSQDRRNLLANA